MVITISCPSCATSFPVDPKKIPEAGAKVRCTACAHVFRIERPAPEPVVLPEITPWPAASEAGPPESDASAADRGGAEEDPTYGLESARAEAPAAEAEEEEAVGGEGAEPREAGFGSGGSEGASQVGMEAEERSWPESAGWIDVPAAEEIASESAPAEAETTLAEPEQESTLVPPAEAVPGPEEPAEPERTLAGAEPAAAEPASVQSFTFGKRDPLDKARRLARVLVSDMVMYNAERHKLALTRGTLTEDFDEEIRKSWKEFVEQVGPELAEGEGRDYWSQALNEILAKGAELF
jgi:predicted Zn finger-like uncharacterized protein